MSLTGLAGPESVSQAWREVCHVGCPYRVGYYYANVFSTQ